MRYKFLVTMGAAILTLCLFSSCYRIINIWSINKYGTPIIETIKKEPSARNSAILVKPVINRVASTGIATDYRKILTDQEREHRMRILEKNNHINKIILYATAVFALLFLVIIALIYSDFKRTRRNLGLLMQMNNIVNEKNHQLEVLAEDLQKSNKEKDKILRVVAHDLRSPVSAIVMMTSIMLDDTCTAEQKEYLELINVSCQSQLTLIEELLEFSNERSGDGIPTEVFDINELLKQTIALHHFRAQEKHQTIDVSTDNLPLYVAAQKERISRVIFNLLTNATKFSPEGSTIFVELRYTPGKVLVVVKDQGIGIPKQLQEVLFEPFTTAKRHGTSGERSFGLGLSISRQILNDNNGRIWFESREGMGSTFYIELPEVSTNNALETAESKDSLHLHQC